MNRFVADQVEAAQDLAGSTVIRWVGTEMALREKGLAGEPEFGDPAIPFLQTDMLYLELEGGARSINTYQNDHNWGLRIRDHESGLPAEHRDEGSIFRTRPLVGLPLGLIEGVRTVLDEIEDLVEVVLTIGGSEVILQAGEVYENSNGALTLIKPDECVLVSVGPLSESEVRSGPDES